MHERPRRSPAQTYALVFGALLAIAGIVGFFYEASFASGDGIDRDAAFGVLDVNGWHNVVHIASGIAGLALARSYSGARTYALAFGVVYVAVTALGFAAGDGGEILGLIPVNTEDNLLHLAIAVLGLAAGAATPAHPAPTTAAAAAGRSDERLPGEPGP